MRTAILLPLVLACSDPVRDHAIERLGDEDPAVPTGPLHRPGQPCVLCHSSGGPASDHPFAVSGTIFESDIPGSRGIADIEVRFVDTRSAGPLSKIVTNEAGNFWVEEKDWTPSFQFRVGIFDKEGRLVAQMHSTVNRDGSCATCHGPNPPTPVSPEEADKARSSVGQIYVEPGGKP